MGIFSGVFRVLVLIAILVACLLQMPPSKIRVIEVAEGETVLLKVKSMYPITLEFQKGTLTAFEVAGGVFTRFASDRPAAVEKAEEHVDTDTEEDYQETQLMDEHTPPPSTRKMPPPLNVTVRKSARKASPVPLHLGEPEIDFEGQTQLEYTQMA